MKSLRRQISSPNALFAFEAASRLKSFKDCAAELNVTQPSVSYQIRQLEESLAVKLFERRGRGVQLSSSGRILSQAVSRGFRIIEEGLAEIQRATNDHLVTLCLSTSQASLVWLPRLSVFRAEYPDIALSLKITDRDVDPRSELADLSVRLGQGNWPGIDAWYLFDEIVFPVCSPAFLEKYGPIRSLEELASQPLLVLEEPYRRRMDWQKWFERLGISGIHIDERFHFSDHQPLIEAAIRGQGMALGWKHDTEILIHQGVLVRPLDVEIKTEHAFYLIASQTNHPVPIHVQKVREWMIRQFKSAENDGIMPHN